MGCNVYIQDDNYVRVVKTGLRVNQFVNDAVKKELDHREQKNREG